MTKRIVSTSSAPAAVGAYSQAIVTGNLMFVSGQIPLDPATGQMVEGDITDQAVRVMENIQQILLAVEFGMDAIVKATIFLTDMNDFAAVNAVYARYFHRNPPARECVAVTALPKNARLEISVIASTGMDTRAQSSDS